MKKYPWEMGLVLLSAVLVLTLVPNCGGGGYSGGGTTTYTPTRIVASWSGGAHGNPTDRTDTEATSWLGSMCPADSVTLTNYDGTVTLHIANSCTLTVTYGICLTEGVAAQPTNGLSTYCATDPFDTSLTNLTTLTLTTGTDGFDYNSTEGLSINIFFCSDQQTLSAPPFSTTVECI